MAMVGAELRGCENAATAETAAPHGRRRSRWHCFAALLVVSAVMFGNVVSASALPAKFYGLQSPYEDSAGNMKIVGHSGADYFRVNFNPSISQEKIKTRFETAWLNGVTILPDVYGGSEPPSNSCALAGNGWRELVQYLAKEFGPAGDFWKGKPNPRPVEAIEIWNEPNRGLNGPDGITAMPGESQYFVNRCAAAIHSVAPSTKVLMGGLLTLGSAGWITDADGKKRYNYTVHDFLEAATALEPALYDGVALHPYAFKAVGEGESKEDIFERVGSNITAGRSAVSMFISSAMPIWITEIGWPSAGGDTNHPTLPEPQRENVLNETFSWIEGHQAAYNIQSLIYYNYRDFSAGTSWDQFCGLLRQLPSNRGIDDAGVVRPEPYSGPLFTGAWTAFKVHAGGDPFYPIAPNATTNGATFVTATEARLLGIYNAHELQSEYQFEWGLTPEYGNKTARHDAGMDNSNHDVVLPGEERWGQLITGLSPGTVYHYRFVVRNENGETAYGADQTFTTKLPPGATTKPATAISQLDAVLNATVDPREEVTDYFFEYGPTASYGSTTPTTRAGYGGPVEVHDEIGGLEYGVTYHFRVVAINYLGTSRGEDKTFTPVYKGPAPAVSTRPATQLGYTSATLNGYVGPNGLETKVYFEYGPTVSYGTKTPEVSAGSGTATVAKTEAISKLNPNVQYHYRMVAKSSAGTTVGVDRTFVPGWAVQSTSKTPGFLEDVSCLSSTDCTAVGPGPDSGTGVEWAVAQHWNGSAWSDQPAPAKPPGATATHLTAVSCTGTSACTAVGRYLDGTSHIWTPLVERWDGAAWTPQSIQSPPSSSYAIFEDVSCAGSKECVAVGVNNGSTLIERWDGNEWKIQTSKNPSPSDNRLTSVSCPSSSYCMAAGFAEIGGAWLPQAQSWSGGEWTQRTVEKPSGSVNSWFFGVSCTGTDVCTAVGQKEVSKETHANQTLAERWDGKGWTEQPTPNPPSTSLNVEDVSCAAGTAISACTAVGTYWEAGLERPLAMAWDKTAGWAMQAPPMLGSDDKVHFFGVSCVVSLGCETVGFHRPVGGVFESFAEGYWRGPPPTVSTGAATSIGDGGATLAASVNPNGSETKYLFEYGPTTAYGSKTSEASAGSGGGTVEKTQTLGGLSPNTTYHYRAVATNDNPDPANGADQTFRTTGPPTPTVGAGVPDPATGKAATLNATINPNGHSTTYQFEYGTASGVYTTTVPAAPASAGAGTSGVPVSYEITGLNRNTKYYFRVSATNSSGKVSSSESSFTTQGAPSAETLGAIEVTRKGAQLWGFVSPHGEATKYWFEYGPTTSYGTKVPLSPGSLGAGQGGTTVIQEATGLKGKTLYHFRVTSENPLGTTFGNDVTFTTLKSTTLKYKAGKALETGAAVKAFSSNFSFNGQLGQHSCGEAELSGTIGENPGALVNLSTTKIQNPGGAPCTIAGAFTVKYAIPTKNMTLEFASNAAGEPVSKVSKFTLVSSLYIGAGLNSTCEYSVELSGTYKFLTNLQTKLTGTATLVKATGGSCVSSEALSAEFTLTGGGLALEAEG